MTEMYVLFVLAGAFAAAAFVALGHVAVAAIRRRRPRRRGLWIAAGLGSAALAGLCIELSTAFAPRPAIDPQAQFEDIPGFEGFGDFDELGRPTE